MPLVNDKLFQSTAQTQVPWTWPLEPPPFGWVEGNSAHLAEPSPKKAPRSPCTSGQTTVPHPNGADASCQFQQLWPTPSLGLQPGAWLSLLLKAQRDLKPSQEATSVALLQRTKHRERS